MLRIVTSKGSRPIVSSGIRCVGQFPAGNSGPDTYNAARTTNTGENDDDREAAGAEGYGGDTGDMQSAAGAKPQRTAASQQQIAVPPQDATETDERAAADPSYTEAQNSTTNIPEEQVDA